MRVVSLVPSATESLSSWGLEPLACTRFCERPDLPHVGGTKDPELDSIVGLAPDLVVMCEEENLLDHHRHLVDAGLDVFVFRIDTVTDVAPQLDALAARVGLDVATPPLAPAPPPVHARAFVPIWRRPWMTMSAGCYGSSLLRAVGVGNVFADRSERYPEVTDDEIREAGPDVVLAPSEPYPFGDRHVPELIRFAPVELVDGKDLFWWGTRTPGALNRLRVGLAR